MSAGNASQSRLQGSIITFPGSSSSLLTNVIGTGSYGAVYHAVSSPDPNIHDGSKSNGVHAVKVLRRCTSNAPQARRVDIENALHRKASHHPNIVAFHAYTFDDTFAYCAMELVRGGDLYDALIERAFCWQRDDVLRHVMLQVVAAVAHCHRLGIAHRDVKPENVLLSPDLSFKLTDFGLATDEPFSNAFNIGTLPYEAPELIVSDSKTGAVYDTKRVDIWALGCVLMICTGLREVWTSARLSDANYAKFVARPGFLRTRIPISREGEALVRRALEPDPRKRITLEELRDAIESIPTFFMDRREIAGSEWHYVRDIAEDADEVYAAWQAKEISLAAVGQQSTWWSQSFLDEMDVEVYGDDDDDGSGAFAIGSASSGIAGLCSDYVQDDEEIDAMLELCYSSAIVEDDSSSSPPSLFSLNPNATFSCSSSSSSSSPGPHTPLDALLHEATALREKCMDKDPADASLDSAAPDVVNDKIDVLLAATARGLRAAAAGGA